MSLEERIYSRPPYRTPIGVAGTYEDHVVICSDGSVWEMRKHSDLDVSWLEQVAVPGTRREAEQEE